MSVAIFTISSSTRWASARSHSANVKLLGRGRKSDGVAVGSADSFCVTSSICWATAGKVACKQIATANTPHIRILICLDILISLNRYIALRTLRTRLLAMQPKAVAVNNHFHTAFDHVGVADFYPYDAVITFVAGFGL